METQDHKTPNSPGNHGHGGLNICHTCGWPFPNHHPSSKQRRAHKRVCGTIDGYRLDNDARDQTRVEAEVNSDDELKIPSEKVVETTISRRSSSGVGSKSSRSARSEEDVFTDAVTEFNESSGAITRETSDGGIERYYSVQNANELNATELPEENSAGTLQTVQKVEGEHDKLGTVLGSRDGNFTSCPVSADVALASDNAVDQNLVQPSELSTELNIVSEIDKDITSPEEVPKEVSILKSDNIEVKGVSNEVMDSVSAGISRKATSTEKDGVEDNGDRCNDVDFPEIDKIEVYNEVNSPGNFYSPPLQIQDINSGNSNARKSDVTEQCDSKIGTNENVHALPVPDVDYKEGKSNFSETTESTDQSMEYSKARVVTEQCDLKSESSNKEKDISSGETKPKDDIELSTALDDDGTKVSEDDFAVKNSVLPKPAVDEVPSQDLELIDTPTNNNMGNLDITVDAAVLKEKELSREVVENVSTDIGHSNVLGVGGSKKNIYCSKETGSVSEAGDIMAVHSEGHRVLTSQCSGEIDSNGENAHQEKFMDDKVSDAVLVTDYHLNSTSKLEVNEYAEYFGQNSVVVNHCSNDKFSEKTFCPTEGDGVISQLAIVPVIDAIVDTSSQSDSLDGNWGSVSVMSVISDAQPTADTIASNHLQAVRGDESPTMIPKPVIENQPSPNQIPLKTEVGIEQMEHASEIQTSKEQQNIKSVLQTGWTPTIGNEPIRGNKDKEIIAKVSNWDSGKEHTPLKTLLGEAIPRSRSESPIHHNQKDVIQGTNNDGFSEKTDNVILNSNHSEMEVAGEEMGEEWDSPAKYPVKIKSEKRRSKSKPYWAPFLCCSSHSNIEEDGSSIFNFGCNARSVCRLWTLLVSPTSVSWMSTD